MSHEHADNGHDEDERDLTPPKGLAASEFMVETWREAKRGQRDAKGARAAAERAAGHALQNSSDIGHLTREVSGLATEVRDLRGDVRRATTRPPALAEMRGELPSGINLEEFARKVAEAAVDGERRPDTTPEEQVEKVVELVAAKREAAAIVKANDVRAKRAEKILMGILLAVVAGLVGHFLK